MAAGPGDGLDDAFPLDFARLRPRRRSNAFLLLPPGFAAATRPDASSPVFPVGRPALLQAVT